MAKNTTLATMRNASLQRADMVNSTFVTTAEVNSLINTYADELYDLLVGAYGEDYFVTSATFNTQSNVDTYSFATIGISDNYKILGVDLQVGSNEAVSLRRFMFRDRNRKKGAYTWNRFARTNIRYRIQGTSLKFVPVPDAAYTMVVWQVPVRANLSADGDAFDGINGWEQFVVVKTAIALKDKEESDTSTLQGELQVLYKRITDMADARDIGEPEKVTDVRTDDYNPTEGGFESW